MAPLAKKMTGPRMVPCTKRIWKAVRYAAGVRYHDATFCSSPSCRMGRTSTRVCPTDGAHILSLPTCQ